MLPSERRRGSDHRTTRHLSQVEEKDGCRGWPDTCHRHGCVRALPSFGKRQRSLVGWQRLTEVGLLNLEKSRQRVTMRRAMWNHAQLRAVVRCIPDYSRHGANTRRVHDVVKGQSRRPRLPTRKRSEGTAMPFSLPTITKGSSSGGLLRRVLPMADGALVPSRRAGSKLLLLLISCRTERARLLLLRGPTGTFDHV